VTAASAAAGPEVASRGVSLELIGLSRRFGSVVALDGLTFSVPPSSVSGPPSAPASCMARRPGS
jgi:hypothetical protein